MTCKSGGKEYSRGELICSNGRELRCDGQEWIETGYYCFFYSDEINDESYYKISFDSEVFIKDNLTEHAKDEIVKYGGCVRIIASPSMNQIRLYNACTTCKTAHLSWSNGTVQRVDVPANDYIDIPWLASSMHIITDSDC
ncbi:hypothetical protein [Acinetobacter johnsonii]|uniref:hypothetical protein n=1 Tax=Acinetobacter johnsonii TaxID=40214 RepID=UPI00244A47AE|nr:hypothetical protein [Acinetobacter johnsonii]MDH1408484.1 hypothetical protein [Acinetobacter johnsonii]